jgi:hypothetical protein
MLAGAFDQWMWRQIVALTLTDVILAWTVFVTGRLVLDYSGERGSAPVLVHKRLWCGVWTVFCIAVALPTLIVAYVYSGDDVKPWPFILFGLFGVFVAALIHSLVHLLRRIIVPPGHAPFGEAIPLLLPKSVLIKASEYPGFVRACDGVLNALRRLPDYLTRGYIDGGGNSSRVLPGHGLAVALSAGFFAVYLFIGVLHCGTAVVYVIILLTVLCWGLSGFAFFLDVFRVPVLICLPSG